jgi:Ca2+-transporting ATPase
MALVRLVLPDRVTAVGAGGQVDPAFRPLLRAAARASVEHGLEPMDQAVLRLHAQAEEPRPAGEVLVRRDGIATGRPYVTALWQRGGSPGGTLAVKGAPEAVLDLCTLSEATRLELLHSAEALAADGLRVLGVAEAPWQGQEPSSEAPAGLRWTGLLGFLDPVRADVPAAMERCRQAGIRVTMITGDAPATALAIARAAGLASQAPSPSCVISGLQLEVMSDQALQDAVATASIFARVSPDQKLRIVRALQQRGEVVAMTGDGVNDASALRAADIGVAMGRRGTDVAREAAALVLLQDNFAAMVEAVRVGRRIFGNLHNAVGYLIAVHVPIVGVSLLPILVGGPVLLLPLHVVLLELIIDPACSLVFEAEPEPEDCMRRPPRPFNVRLLSTRAARRAVAIGSLALALTVGSVMLGRAMALDAHWLRLVALVALVAGNLLMLHWYRRGARWRGEARINAAFRWLLAGVCGALAIVALLSGPLPQLGLPDHPGLRTTGLVLALASLAGIALLLRGIRLDAAGPAGGKGTS